jgi:alpha/beta superfamily hydrolase
MNRDQLRHRGIAGAFLAALILTGCGGGSDSDPIRGGIVGVDAIATLSRAEIDAAATAAGFAPLAGPAACDVTTRRVRYETLDPRGNFATASTAVMVPSGSAACLGARPVVLYAHGTTTLRSFNMADLAKNGEGALVAAMFAAQGFIVVAPNYLGYDTSSLRYHPYLNGEAQARDMIDGLRAASAYLRTSSQSQPSGRLFLTGYSQGGYVALATQKVLQRDHANEFSVSGAVPMSGPYNLVTFGDVVTGPGPINGGATIFVPLLLTSYQQSYGDIYTNASDVYQTAFAATAPTLFPTDTSIDDLKAQGRLPAPDPGNTQLFGTGGLLTDAFRAGYATSNYRKALQRNTLITVTGVDGTQWTPAAPMALCGGALDPVVFWSVNTPAAVADFNSRRPSTAPVLAWDLENRSSLPAGASGDAIFAGWQGAKTAQGANLQAAYHGLAAPFCTALARGLFQQVLAAPTP